MSTTSAGLRVLVVDDHSDNRESCRMLVTLWGHDVLTAAGGAEALTLAGTFHPHVLLIDVGMPGLDGYETARRLRQLPTLAGSVLMAVSGFADDGHVRHALAAGFDGYFDKPVEPDALEQMLNRIVAQLAATSTTSVPA
jgi:CheY-like chemotaxis protein